MKNPIENLTEYEEQKLLVEYLEANNIKFSKIAQETFTRSFGQKMKNKMSGLRRGLPDLLIVLPAEKTYSHNNILVFIEMKRKKGGHTSPEQQEWIELLNRINGKVFAFVAKGYEEAKKVIESFFYADNNSTPR
jgi:hypothetical protein